MQNNISQDCDSIFLCSQPGEIVEKLLLYCQLSLPRISVCQHRLISLDFSCSAETLQVWLEVWWRCFGNYLLWFETDWYVILTWAQLILTPVQFCHLQSYGLVVALVWNVHRPESSHAGLGSLGLPRESSTLLLHSLERRDVKQGKYQCKTIVLNVDTLSADRSCKQRLNSDIFLCAFSHSWVCVCVCATN